MHADLRIESLALTPSLPMDYFVGDVAVTENAYYMYRRNSRYGGLWRIALDPADPGYLSPIQVAEASALQLKIFDLAFHPNDGYAYSVDSRGRLWRIDVSDGGSTELGNVGQSGTFGAVYFDDTGTLYISRNKDGKIFSIGVHSAAPSAELFSYGPASSNNDGARCALAMARRRLATRAASNSAFSPCAARPAGRTKTPCWRLPGTSGPRWSAARAAFFIAPTTPVARPRWRRFPCACPCRAR